MEDSNIKNYLIIIFFFFVFKEGKKSFAKVNGGLMLMEKIVKNVLQMVKMMV